METLEVKPQDAALFRAVLAQKEGLLHGSLLITFRNGQAQKIDRAVSLLLNRPAAAGNAVFIDGVRQAEPNAS